MMSKQRHCRTSRREFLRFVGLLAASVTAWWKGLTRRVYGQGELAITVRPVAAEDERALVEVMRSCVAKEEAFHGYCEGLQWTEGWAEEALRKRPQALVASMNGEVVGHCNAPLEPARVFGELTADRYQKAYWCAAAGVREDLLGQAEAEKVFLALLRQSFRLARALGHEYVRATARFDKHPRFREHFADYPGVEVSPFLDADGNRRYLLVSHLDEAIAALEEEGEQAAWANAEVTTTAASHNERKSAWQRKQSHRLQLGRGGLEVGTHRFTVAAEHLHLGAHASPPCCSVPDPHILALPSGPAERP